MTQTITSVSREHRVFRPSAEFKAQANLGSDATYKRLYAESVNSPERFWAREAHPVSHMAAPIQASITVELAVLQVVRKRTAECRRKLPGPPFEHGQGQQGGDHLRGRAGRCPHPDLTGSSTAKCANSPTPWREPRAGPRRPAAIYLPMVPEAAIAMLACARLGVVHTVIFGGFSSEAIKDWVNDCQARIVITADGGWRRGKIVELKANVDRALSGAPSV